MDNTTSCCDTQTIAGGLAYTPAHVHWDTGTHRHWHASTPPHFQHRPTSSAAPLPTASTTAANIPFVAEMNRVSTFTQLVCVPRSLPGIAVRVSPRLAYSTNKKKQRISSLMDRIGDENSKESQKTIKIVRTIGVGSIVVVLCSLFWASAMSAPVKETFVETPDLSKDVRNQ